MFERERSDDSGPDKDIVDNLGAMLDDNNELVKAFWYAKERLDEHGDEEITLRLMGFNAKDEVQYNLPSSGEIAAIVVGDC